MHSCSSSKEDVFCLRLQNDQSKPKKSLLKIWALTQKVKYFNIFKVNYFVMRKETKILYLKYVGKGDLGID